jgi:glycosyltransferase involved in cell wall biosynthesis
MLSTPPELTTVKLSICIATFNRAAALRATLERVFAQVEDGCEVVVSDNASTDDTERVVSEFTRRFGCLRYVRQEVNRGFERNFDCAVRAATGAYCWLMPDDDLLKSGAVAAVLKALRRSYSLVVVNAELTDSDDVSKLVLQRRLNFDTDRVYAPRAIDQLFADLSMHLHYIGCVVIKRSLWLDRNQEPYFGSMFVHVGVIFQAPLPEETLVIADTLMSISLGGQFWISRAFEVFGFRWPSLVQSLAVSESAKKHVSAQSRDLRFLMSFRAYGFFSLAEYKRWLGPYIRFRREKLLPIVVALLPGRLVNALYVLFYSLARRADREVVLLLLRKSRFHLTNL